MDKKILHNIFINLISNAIKYSDTDILINTKVESDMVYIDFIDKGIGIPEDEQKLLFTKFFRAKNVVNIQGTGLGLSIVKHYVNLMEGDITFKSELGKGTTFTLSLPINT
jgi:signal transduction histidine kinase